MSTLPEWITPRMKESFAKILEDLFLYQTNGIVTFSTFGVAIQDNNQQQHYIPTTNLCQYPEFMNNFLADETNNLEFPPVLPTAEVFDCSDFLEEFDVSTTPIEAPTVESNIDMEEVMELAKFVNLVPTTEIEEQPTELTDEQWETKLEKEIKEIYSVRIDKEQKLLHYFEVGKMLRSRPTKYQRQLQQIKKVIHRKIGRKFTERPYLIAKRTFKIFKTKESLLQSTHGMTPNKIYRMDQQEINEQLEKIQK